MYVGLAACTYACMHVHKYVHMRMYDFTYLLIYLLVAGRFSLPLLNGAVLLEGLHW